MDIFPTFISALTALSVGYLASYFARLYPANIPTRNANRIIIPVCTDGSVEVEFMLVFLESYVLWLSINLGAVFVRACVE